MDSWSYGGSVFLANETLLHSDSFAENRKAMAGFEQGLCNELETDDDVLLMSHMAGKSNGAMATSSSLLSSSVATQELTRIDFKVRSFLDYGNNNDTSSSKKPRALSSERPLCQVYGCNMDLSHSKDYHKRHRVCDAHSKTSVVIVSGIEQRFCQQCSRFHFLSEFDDGKRSCRRRLAGHNERRRKPSFYFLPSKPHKLLRTSQGNKFLEDSSVDDFSLVLPEAFSGGVLYRVMDEHNHHHHHRASRLVSFKDEPTRSTCALSLLSAQSQEHFSAMPNASFSITQPNQNLDHSRMDYHHHQVQPSWTGLGKNGSSSCNGKGSSTVDLVQLSSHLQRIEQQRNVSDEVKQEYNELYFPG
ncbi:unnamed protein product [Microthlaspi erraticum]|uniref:SBP-type domain-containing protein n=1 Tax=Microthlaspi erraticum TaxID=1685480 RepID=A0A6D2K9K3_9BRAS|nr:unnamed protein product [Microthlaspi erraticum]CAA7053620.1 unnamed protein product [Microthlaspi erraticum]